MVWKERSATVRASGNSGVTGNVAEVEGQSLLYTSSGHISNLSTVGALVGRSAVRLSNGVEHEGRISSGTDVDWYSFAVSESGGLTVYWYHDRAYMTVRMYNSEDARLRGSTSGSLRVTTGDFSLDVDKGTYFLRVSGQEDTDPFDYDITATFEADD